MSLTAQINATLQVISAGQRIYQSLPTIFIANMDNGAGPSPGLTRCSTEGTIIDLSQLDHPSLCRIMNQDALNFVTVGSGFPGTGAGTTVSVVIAGGGSSFAVVDGTYTLTWAAAGSLTWISTAGFEGALTGGYYAFIGQQTNKAWALYIVTLSGGQINDFYIFSGPVGGGPQGVYTFVNSNVSGTASAPPDLIAVTEGSSLAGAFVPMMDILPLESYIIRLSQFLGIAIGPNTGTGTSGVTQVPSLMVKANTSECLVLVEAFNA